jgi:hypothetical protein
VRKRPSTIMNFEWIYVAGKASSLRRVATSSAEHSSAAEVLCLGVDTAVRGGDRIDEELLDLADRRGPPRVRAAHGERATGQRLQRAGRLESTGASQRDAEEQWFRRISTRRRPIESSPCARPNASVLRGRYSRVEMPESSALRYAQSIPDCSTAPVECFEPFHQRQTETAHAPSFSGLRRHMPRRTTPRCVNPRLDGRRPDDTPKAYRSPWGARGSAAIMRQLLGRSPGRQRAGRPRVPGADSIGFPGGRRYNLLGKPGPLIVRSPVVARSSLGQRSPSIRGNSLRCDATCGLRHL